MVSLSCANRLFAAETTDGLNAIARRSQDYLRNGSKPGRHNLMELSLSQMSDEWLDQHSRFALPNERRCCGNDSFGAGNAH